MGLAMMAVRLDLERLGIADGVAPELHILVHAADDDRFGVELPVGGEAIVQNDVVFEDIAVRAHGFGFVAERECRLGG